MVALANPDSSFAQFRDAWAFTAANKAASCGLADSDPLTPGLEGDDSVEIGVLGLTAHSDRLRLEAIAYIIEQTEGS
jgi:hypothetical protein